MPPDKRRTPRIQPFVAPCRILEDPGPRPLAGYLTDLSTRGAQVSTQALDTLASNDIPVSYLTGHGRFVGVFQAAPTKNVMLRQNQYQVFADPAKALELAKAVVRAKLSNQRTLLMR